MASLAHVILASPCSRRGSHLDLPLVLSPRIDVPSCGSLSKTLDHISYMSEGLDDRTASDYMVPTSNPSYVHSDNLSCYTSDPNRLGKCPQLQLASRTHNTRPRPRLLGRLLCGFSSFAFIFVAVLVWSLSPRSRRPPRGKSSPDAAGLAGPSLPALGWGGCSAALAR